MLVALSLPLIWRVIDTKHEKQHLEVSNMLSFQVLHSFWFTVNELQIRSLYIWPIEDTHVLYSKMAAACLATPIVMPTAKGLYDGLPTRRGVSECIYIIYTYL